MVFECPETFGGSGEAGNSNNSQRQQQRRTRVKRVQLWSFLEAVMIGMYLESVLPPMLQLLRAHLPGLSAIRVFFALLSLVS